MTKARILFLDIEASNLAANLGFLISIGYKWSDEKKVHVLRIDETEEFKKKHTDDTGLLKKFEEVYKQADIVVHHYGDYYDIPFIQTRRLLKRLNKLPDVRTVDTWRICRNHLKFHNNRLDTVLKALKCPYAKTPLDGEKWLEAMGGDKKAINYIVEHNKNDVLVLEWVYNHIAPMIPSHPKVSSIKANCKVCNSNRVQKAGKRICKEGWYQRLQCQSCGHTMKGERIYE